jgi:hypothetical protein
MKTRLILGIVSVAVLVGVTATTSLADPDLVNVPTHRHWLGDPANGVQIGPRLCDNPNLQKAFNQFHFNVHHSFIPPPAGPGQIDTLGPQDGAPGLINGHGGELTFTVIGPDRCGLPPGVEG